MQSIKFERTNGNIPKTAAGLDHVSGFLAYVTALPEGFSDENRIQACSSIETAEKLGITSDEGAAWEIRMLHYHLSEIYRLNPGISLYVGLFAKPTGGTYTFSEVKSLQNYAGGSLRQVAVWCGHKELEAGDLTALQGIATYLQEYDRPLSIGYAPKVGSVTSLPSSLAGAGKCNVSVIIGQAGKGVGAQLYADKDNTGKASVSGLGVWLGITSKAAVHQSIAAVEKFPTGIDLPAFGDGTLLRDLDTAIVENLDVSRYLFFVTYDGFADSYFNDSHTMDDAVSDYAYIENVRTMDKAVRGIRFTQMYTSAPLSSPARCGLLTGRHSGHADIRANDEMEWRGDVWNHEAMLRDSTLEGQAPMQAGTPTLGTVLRDAGYSTGMIGKWGVGGPASESTPGKMGFDTYFGCICQRQAHTYYPPFLWENDRRFYLSNRLVAPGTPLDEGADPFDPHSYDKYTQTEYSPDLMYDRVLSFVRENRDRPFFLMWTTPLPHSPMQAPDADVRYYVDKFGDESPIEGRGYYPSRWPHATYAAMITYFDRQIGGLVAELDRLGILDNTLIVITSDNGPASNSCSSSEWFDSARPFRCGKGWGKSSLREGGIRIPFIVAWGDRLRPRVCDRIGYFPDVMPTLCDLAGVRTPRTDGISFRPLLDGRGDTLRQHEYLYWEFPGSNGWVAVRWGDWKGLLRRVKAGNGQMELFNLADDPRETHDVAAEHPEIVERMWSYVFSSHEEPENPKFRMRIEKSKSDENE